MEPILRIYVILLTINLCLSDGGFVSKDEFIELIRIVDAEKTKYDELDRKYKILEKTLKDVLLELKDTKSRIPNAESENQEPTAQKINVIKEDEWSQKHYFNPDNTYQDNKMEMTRNVLSESSKTKMYEPRQLQTIFHRRAGLYFQLKSVNWNTS